MHKRNLLVSSPCYISVKHGQIQLKFEDETRSYSLPTEDFGLVLLDHQQISCSQHFLQLAAQHNIGVLLCDAQHLPCSMLLPLVGHPFATRAIQATSLRHN